MVYEHLIIIFLSISLHPPAKGNGRRFKNSCCCGINYEAITMPK